MAQNISYGIGQYRYDQHFEYTTDLTSSGSYIPRYVDYNTNSGLTYKDVIIPLPEGIVAGETYLMTLTLPQDPQFDNTINLKLCAESNQAIDFNKFQQIKQVTVPRGSAGNYYVPVALFKYTYSENNKTSTGIEAEIVHDFSSADSIKNETLYKYNNNYKYASNDFDEDKPKPSWDAFNSNYKINHIVEYSLAQSWTESSPITTTSISFIFSPKYDLINPYKYLWLEIVRNDIDLSIKRVLPIVDESALNNTESTTEDNTESSAENNESSAEDNTEVTTGDTEPSTENDESTTEDNKNYYIVMTISKVNNLISSTNYGIASIKSGINKLCQIDVQASEGQKLSINGEEIIIGAKETYSLKDFDITSLGIIVPKPTPGNYNFQIDYKYAIEN